MIKNTITIRLFIFAGCLFLLSPSVFLYARDNEIIDEGDGASDSFELDAIVVTANKVDEPVEKISKHVTVITSEDIRESSATNISDLLAQESGINVRSALGNDKQAVVDIRGMGDTAASNVIVMVDDLMINAPDQSGLSLSSIPIEQIERIEIVRGAGSVVYGSGAVGGVINIITKKPGKVHSAQLYSSLGSYKTVDNRVSFGGSLKSVNLDLNAGLYNSDGYRDNGFFRKKDISAKSNYEFNDRFSFNASGFYYEDDYGLPGPVSKEDVNSRSRRVNTDRPNDSGETSEWRGRFELDMDFEKWGALNLKRGYLSRDNRYIIGLNPQISRSDQKDKIDEDTRQFDLNYVKNYAFGGNQQMFQLGIDHYKTEYYREERSDGPRKNSETESFGIFINNRWSVFENLTLNAGSRFNHYQGQFRTDERKLFDDEKIWVNGDTTKSEWENSAYSIGFTYSISQETTFFSSYATSFRIPNVDEFAESEKGLKPQEGVHVEVGARRQFGSFISMSIALFDIRIDDEIYYSDINRNYDERTIRQGIEADFTLYPIEDIRLSGNYTFTKAEFEKTNATIPLVPEHMVSGGIYWQMTRPLAFSLSGVYIGSRFDGNDTDNDQYDKLDAAIVFDTKLTYEYKNMSIFAGINNIFDELYSTSAYSEQYYPMPGRTIYGGIRCTYF
jgi:outer membrane receptor protein involved in Fe transport